MTTTTAVPPAIETLEVTRTFGGEGGVRDLTLQAPAGDLFALLGPSGSGKTTTLRLIAGFERPDSGVIRLRGETVASDSVHVPPERRRIGMVFQDYALFPHMSVAENVAYGLPRDADRALRVEEALALTGLPGFGRRAVHDLSGGEQQRVALARALAPRPGLLLLDEPFSNLDAALRAQVRTEVRQIVKESGVTALLVTHDQEEALSIADRIAFMWRGGIEQSGTPDEIYRNPASLHVAQSIGDANLIEVEAAGGRIETPLGVFGAPAGARRCVAVVRPEDVQLASAADAGPAGRIVEREYYGHDQVLHVEVAGGLRLRVRTGPYEQAPGPAVSVILRRPPLVFPVPEEATA